MKNCASLYLRIVTLGAALAASVPASAGGSWLNWGNTVSNNRSAVSETNISVSSAASLAVRWSYTANGDISATPTIEGNDLYVPDYGGWIHKLNRYTGAVTWKHALSEYTGNSSSYSRSSPAIGDSVIVVGDRGGGATVIAINKTSGALAWKKQIESDKTAVITGSPVIYNGVVYVGVSSLGEVLPNDNTSTYRGSVAALDLSTGATLWQFYTVPQGYAGGSVWGSTPVVDAARGSLYITSGNNVSVPDAVATCMNNTTNALAQLACSAPNDYFDSVIALDLKTGQPKWGRRLNSADVWFVDCTLHLPGCQVPGSPDYDFGSGPNLINVTINGQPTQILGAGQKSGIYWALNPDTGNIVWGTPVGPGSFLGGIEWGSATDGQRIYVSVANATHQSFGLGGGNNGQTWNAGSVAALDAGSGRFIWQVPQLGMSSPTSKIPSAISPPMTIANGVLFAGSGDGTMAAINAATGSTLWQFASGGTVMSGPSIVDGWVYWGSGYSSGTDSNIFYAFAVPSAPTSAAQQK